jgi:hypothetical protein
MPVAAVCRLWAGLCVCGLVTLSVQEDPGVQASVTGATYVPGAQSVPEVAIVIPDGELVTSTLPAGIVGANATPLKLESAGAVASTVNVLFGLGFVVADKLSVIPNRYVGSRSAMVYGVA